jgi:hypothetical protein
MAAPPVMPVPPVTPEPPVLPAGNMVTAPAPARVVAPAPAPSLGSFTSVIPTRLKAPSPVTSGEVVTNGPTQAPTRAPGLAPDAEDSGIGASTSRVQGAGEASSTGSMHAPASGSRVADTDPHSRYTASRSQVASRKPSFVLGLLGTLGGAAAVLAGYLVVVSSEPPAEVGAPLEPAKATVASAAGGAPSPTGEPAGPPSVVEPASPPPSAAGQTQAPSQPAPSGPVPTAQPASEPPKAKVQPPKPASKPASKPTKPTAPLTDGTVMSRLEASMKKKCRAHASDAVVAVKLIVANDGRVINKNGAVTGASPALKACLVEQLSAARFPAAGSTRNLSASLRW